jgi:hypothetical protein
MTAIIPMERIENSIYFIRSQKVILDRDLDRFPADFMFELSKEAFENWRPQFVTSKSDKIGLK